MKNLGILLSVLVSTSSAFAFAPRDHAVAGYEFGHASDGQQPKFYKVKLTNQGRLVVGIANSQLPSSKKTTSFELSKSVAHELKSKAAQLGNAKITEVNNAIVCMMMPPLGASVDHLYVLSETTQQMTLVDGPRGCWVGHKIYPTDVHFQQIARELKVTLRALAIELSKN